MDIAILGAGVAGVASAIALKLKGFDVRIFERHPAASHIGAGIVLWPNACHVLDRLGVLAEMQAVAGRPRAMRRRSPDGAELGALDIGIINERMGYDSLSILRADFHRILVRQLGALGIDVEYGREVADIMDDAAGGHALLFADGSATRVDLVIGADGRMASRARRYVTGGAAPVYQGFVNWIGVFESGRAIFDDAEIGDYWGVGTRFGIVPISRHAAYWAGGAACSQPGARDPANYRRELMEAFSDWPQPIAALIEGTPLERVNKIHVHDHDPIAAWHRDRVIAIGDAAHASLPTSGQGACQALEDAWHLANALAAAPDDPERAFAQFTLLRAPKTRAITMAGRAIARSLFSEDRQACALRDEASRRTDFGALAAGMADGWRSGLDYPALA